MAWLTFSDSVCRRSRWTEWLCSTLAAVGLALAGRAGARMARVFGVSVSRSAVLRLLDALPDPETPTPQVVGVDEYAMRKGPVYGTVRVDVETRRPVDLLPDREAAGQSCRAIQRQPGMTYRTVKFLADATAPEDLFRGQWQGRPSVLDEYKPYLDDRWNQGCTNAWKAWEEIVPLGYKGSYQRVRAYFRAKRLSTDPVTAPPPSPRTVAGWILRRPDTLTGAEQLRLKTVLVHCSELDALTGLVRSFAEILTERQGRRLPEWLDAVRNDNLPGLHTLAAGIDRDCRRTHERPHPRTDAKGQLLMR
ncbi:hypothetical protein [Streptomyces sp. NPDC058653]|uniref:hypothetical protein n=1 Tax=Streptomyces sp. NPDC058653 TaxID=3346576 RepID=UPI0036545CEE